MPCHLLPILTRYLVNVLYLNITKLLSLGRAPTLVFQPWARSSRWAVIA